MVQWARFLIIYTNLKGILPRIGFHIKYMPVTQLHAYNMYNTIICVGLMEKYQLSLHSFKIRSNEPGKLIASVLANTWKWKIYNYL
jgi:hypothetical protein